MKEITESELIEKLRKRASESTQRAVAQELGISIQMLNDLLHGRRQVSDRLASVLGFERRVVFRKVA